MNPQNNVAKQRTEHNKSFSFLAALEYAKMLPFYRPLKDGQKQIVIIIHLIAIHDLFIVNKGRAFVFIEALWT